MVKRICLMLALLLALCCCALGEEDANTQVKHYLLLGQDGYAETLTEDARTDTVVLVSLDMKYNRVIMTSILRDSQITNPRGNDTKVNLLYKYHGFDGMIACLERELNIEIEGAVLINFNNVKPVIDALGGVDIEINADELSAIRRILLNDDPNMPEAPGLVHMTGRIALAYMRDRTTGSDFSRTQHQREVLGQLLAKCRSLSLPELIGIYNEVSSGMKTSLSALSILGVLSSGYSLLVDGATFEEFSIPQQGLFQYGSMGSSSTLIVNWRANRNRFHALLDNPPAQK